MLISLTSYKNKKPRNIPTTQEGISIYTWMQTSTYTKKYSIFHFVAILMDYFPV